MMLKIYARRPAQLRQSDRSGAPFVCHLEPFVCSKIGMIKPFVCQKWPLVLIGGFTLIELIVALVVAGILFALAAPNFGTFILRDRLVTQANNLVADLSFARSEAIKRAAPVIVCKTTDPAATPPACSTVAADPWTKGRVIWVDLNGDGNINANEVLRVRQAVDGSSNKLTGETDAQNAITFSSLGMASVTTNTQLVVCDDRGPSQALAIAILPTGRATVMPKGQDKDGNALTSADCP
jgi:type IV fimbrial biogenesis protein FimT